MERMCAVDEKKIFSAIATIAVATVVVSIFPLVVSALVLVPWCSILPIADILPFCVFLPFILLVVVVAEAIIDWKTSRGWVC